LSTELIQRCAWSWEEHIDRLGDLTLRAATCSSAARANVGDEHIWKGIEGSLVALHELCDVACHEVFVFTALGGSRSDGDGSAIHVHLAIADFVEPGPSEDGSASWEIGGNSERVGVGVDFRSALCRIIANNVFPGAAAFDGMDDLELAARRRSFVVGDRELAGPSSVDGASYEGNGLRRSKGERIAGSLRIVDAGALLTGEVAAVPVERGIVESGLAEGLGRRHLHVCGAEGCESEDHEGGICGEHHLE